MPNSVVSKPETNAPVDRLSLQAANVRSGAGGVQPDTHNYAADWCMAGE
jgi:hypothetical protein